MKNLKKILLDTLVLVAVGTIAKTAEKAIVEAWKARAK